MESCSLTNCKILLPLCTLSSLPKNKRLPKEEPGLGAKGCSILVILLGGLKLNKTVFAVQVVGSRSTDIISPHIAVGVCDLSPFLTEIWPLSRASTLYEKFQRTNNVSVSRIVNEQGCLC